MPKSVALVKSPCQGAASVTRQSVHEQHHDHWQEQSSYACHRTWMCGNLRELQRAGEIHRSGQRPPSDCERLCRRALEPCRALPLGVLRGSRPALRRTGLIYALGN